MNWWALFERGGDAIHQVLQRGTKESVSVPEQIFGRMGRFHWPANVEHDWLR